MAGHAEAVTMEAQAGAKPGRGPVPALRLQSAAKLTDSRARSRCACPRGVLQISREGPAASIWMTAPAASAFEGRVDV